MRYLIGQNAIVGPFVAAHIPHCGRGFGDKIMTLGVVDGERLIGGLVFHNHDPEAAIIEISGAAIDPRWLTRETLAADALLSVRRLQMSVGGHASAGRQ